MAATAAAGAGVGHPHAATPLLNSDRGGGGRDESAVARAAATWGSHLAALTVKSFRVLSRRPVSVSIAVAFPAIMVVLLHVTDQAVRSGVASAVFGAPVPVPTLDRCTSFDVYGNAEAAATTPCVTLAFAPSGDPRVHSIMAHMATATGLDQASDMMVQPSATHLARYIFDNPGVIDAAVVLKPGAATDEDATVTTSASTWEYTVWTNDTSAGNYATEALQGTARLISEQIGVAPRRLALQTALDAAIIDVTSGQATVSLRPTLDIFPQVQKKGAVADLSSGGGFVLLGGALFINVGVMVVALTALHTVADEKHAKLLGAMRAMGVWESTYWLSWFAVFAVLSALASVVMVAVGRLATGLYVFTKVDFGVSTLVMTLFSSSFSSMCLAIASFVTQPRWANTATFVLFFVALAMSILLSVYYEGLYAPGTPTFLKVIVFTMPWVHFGKVFTDMISVVGFEGSRWTGDFSWADLFKLPPTSNVPGSGGTFPGLGAGAVQPAVALGGMCLCIVGYLILAWYLGQVFAGSEGASLRAWFPFTREYWGFAAVSTAHAKAGDLLAELKQQSGRTGSVRVHKLSKAYSSKTALREVSLSLEPGQCTAVLGRNGAGKTSLVNCLSGRTAPTFGEVYMFGHSVRDSISTLRDVMGVCPQHDLLYPQLTGREHGELYAALKKTPRREIKAVVRRALEVVHLDGPEADEPVSSYSGGMARRLSVALASIGDPRIIFLDEPSAGLDPLSRQRVHNVIDRLKVGTVLVLNTHDLEEAEAIGDKVVILDNGSTRAIGTPLFLRERFGTGYQVKLLAQPRMHDKLKELVSDYLPAAELIADDARNLTVGLPLTSMHVPVFLRELERNTSVVREWGLSHSTLEEVFLRLCQGAKEVSQYAGEGGGEPGDGSGSMRGEHAPPPLCALCGRNRAEAVTLFTADGVEVQVAGIICNSCAHGARLEDRRVDADADAAADAAAAGAGERTAAADASTSNEAAGAARGREAAEESPTSTAAATESSPHAAAPATGGTPPRAHGGRMADDGGPSDAASTAVTLHAPTRNMASYSAAPPPTPTMPSGPRTARHRKVDPSRFEPVSLWSQASALVWLRVGSEALQAKTNCCRCCCVVIAVVVALASGGSKASDSLIHQYDLCGSPPRFYVDKSLGVDYCNETVFVDSLVDDQVGPTVALWGTCTALETPGVPCPAPDVYDGVNWRSASATAGRLYNSNDAPNPLLLAVNPARVAYRDAGGAATKFGDLPGIEDNETVVVFANAASHASWTTIGEGVRQAEVYIRDHPNHDGLNASNVCAHDASSEPASRYFSTVAAARRWLGDNFPDVAISFDALSASHGGSGVEASYTVTTWPSYLLFLTPYSDVMFPLGQIDNPNDHMCAHASLGPIASYDFPDTKTPPPVAPIATVMSGIHNALLRQTAGSDASIRATFKPMPPITYIAAVQTSGMGGLLFVLPMITSLLLPTLVGYIVSERQNKLVMMMEVSGMRSSSFWAGNYVFSVTFTMVISTLFTTLCYIVQVHAMTNASPLLFLALFVTWSHAQVGMSFFLAAVLARSRFAQVFTYLLVVVMSVGSTLLGQALEVWPTLLLALVPPAAFVRAASLILTFGGDSIAPSSPLAEALLWLAFTGTAMMLLGMWLYQVVPAGTDGTFVAKHPLFCLRGARQCVRRMRGRGASGPSSAASGAHLGAPLLGVGVAPAAFDDTGAGGASATPHVDEDVDVAAERGRVLGGLAGPGAVVELRGVRKVYQGGGIFGGSSTSNVAVDDLWLAIGGTAPEGSPTARDASGRSADELGGAGATGDDDDGGDEEAQTEVLALLGPNGAGKSTTISCLCGSMYPTRGAIKVCGFDTATDMARAHRAMGVCPQFDCVWDELTVRAHLEFYAAIKGVPGNRKAAEVMLIATKVGLDGDAMWLKAQQLSGGQRRRLSLGIALMGSPLLLVADEPTTGVDPETRRAIWAVIQNARSNGVTVLVSSHSMEETETLATRVAIMANGQLRCLGTQQHLRDRFGGGYALNLGLRDDSDATAARAHEFVLSKVSRAAVLTSRVGTSVKYQLPKKARGDDVDAAADGSGGGSSGSGGGGDNGGVSPADLFAVLVKATRRAEPRGASSAAAAAAAGPWEGEGTGIEQWGVAQTSFAEIFMRVVREAEGGGGGAGGSS